MQVNAKQTTETTTQSIKGMYITRLAPHLNVGNDKSRNSIVRNWTASTHLAFGAKGIFNVENKCASRNECKSMVRLSWSIFVSEKLLPHTIRGPGSAQKSVFCYFKLSVIAVNLCCRFISCSLHKTKFIENNKNHYRPLLSNSNRLKSCRVLWYA